MKISDDSFIDFDKRYVLQQITVKMKLNLVGKLLDSPFSRQPGERH